MSGKSPIDKILERSLRETLAGIKSMEPPDRIAALKLALEWVKFQKLKGHDWGSAFSAEADLGVTDPKDSDNE